MRDTHGKDHRGEDHCQRAPASVIGCLGKQPYQEREQIAAEHNQGLVPTELAVEAFRRQISISGPGPYLFSNPDNPAGYQASFKKVWATTLRKAGVPYFRMYDLRSTYATRLSAGGVADEWVTQLRRQGDAKVFKKYSQMKLQMKREALAKIDRKANDKGGSGTGETS